jgi:hypothetical protein
MRGLSIYERTGEHDRLYARTASTIKRMKADFKFARAAITAGQHLCYWPHLSTRCYRSRAQSPSRPARASTSEAESCALRSSSQRFENGCARTHVNFTVRHGEHSESRTHGLVASEVVEHSGPPRTSVLPLLPVGRSPVCGRVGFLGLINPLRLFSWADKFQRVLTFSDFRKVPVRSLLETSYTKDLAKHLNFRKKILISANEFCVGRSILCFEIWRPTRTHTG